MEDPTRTSFGDISPHAPAELRAFSFLIGKWQGEGRTRLPDGSPYLGMSLRQFDAARKTWIIEFLNVTGAFLRRQVNGNAGSVTLDGGNVMVASGSPGMNIREHYLVTGNDAFTYRLDISTDEGRNWTEGQMEISMRRAG